MRRFIPALLATPMFLTLGAVPAVGAPYGPDPSSCVRSEPTITVTGADPELVIGTEGDDVVYVSGGTHTVRTLGGDDSVCAYYTRLAGVELGRGDDELVVLDDTAAPEPPALKGGRGRDRVVGLYDEKVHLDLERGVLRGKGKRSAARFDLAAFENASVSAHEATLRGDEGRNDLSSYSCSAKLSGAAGPDTIRTTGFAWLVDFTPTPNCHGYTFLGRGGPGADRLIGRARSESLFGGRGHDLADGKNGIDRCVAEVERRCER